LRFTNRGVVATAGLDGLHNSIFFISLAPNIAINRDAHTIFAKVVGDSVYNLVKLNDFQVDEEEHPLFPPLIQRAEVISNPFPDVRPRTDPPWQSQEEAAQRSNKVRPSRAKPKNTQLLSFGEEGEEELLGAENGGNALKMSSAIAALPPSFPHTDGVPEQLSASKRAKLGDGEVVASPVRAVGGSNDISSSSSSISSDDSSDEDTGKGAKKRKEGKKKKKKKKKDKKRKPKKTGLGLKDVSLDNAHVVKKSQKNEQNDIEAKFDAFRKHLQKK